jgi:competence protein ComEC
MVSHVKLSPVLCAACGAAAGFYCKNVLLRASLAGINGLFVFLCIPAAALCFLWALVSFCLLRTANGSGESPGAGGASSGGITRHARLLRQAGRLLAAFTAGIAIGLGAAGAAASGTGFGIPEQSVQAVSGVLLEDPRIVSGGRAMAVLALREASGQIPGASGTLRASAKGELPVFFPGENAARLREFGRGSVIFAGGKIRESPRGNAASGKTSLFFSADSAHVVQPAPAFERFRTGVRLNLIRRFGGASWGGLALALLLGVKDNLDSGLAALYRDAGCSYVLALSGMHLAVLAGIIALLLRKPLGLKAASAAGALIIICYCCIVGPLPSLVRAALMYLLGTLAILGALRRDGLSLLGMAFLIQIVISPEAGFSLSFILSYLALAGILTAGEALNGMLEGCIPACLLRPLSASLGAFLATAGVTAYFFGTLRLAGIVTGLFLVPLTTVFMIGSLIWLVLNLISPVLSGFLSFPLSLLYGVMEKTVSLASSLPGLDTSRPPLALVLSLGLWLLVLWFAERRRLAQNRLAAFN